MPGPQTGDRRITNTKEVDLRSIAQALRIPFIVHASEDGDLLEVSEEDG